MPYSRVNLEKIANKLANRTHRLKDVEGKIVRMGFDQVRFKGDEDHKLWEICPGEDGDYIVANFDDSEDLIATASKNPWETVIKNSEINLFYKKDFVIKIAASTLGVDQEEIEKIGNSLPRSLVNDKSLIAKLVLSLDGKVRTSILSKYPELS